jgi:hypothetical protein
MIYLIICCTACSRHSNSHVLISSHIDYKSFNVTAALNDSTWFGSASAEREYAPTYESCTNNRFTLNVVTDIPHILSHGEPQKGVTGCTGQCIPTQWLKLREIPMTVGRYKLSDLKLCLKENTMAVAEYNLLIGGDLAINRYYPAGITIWQGRSNEKIPGNDHSWIEITKYDSSVNQIEGMFDIKLIGQNKEVAHFKKGIFKVSFNRK